MTGGVVDEFKYATVADVEQAVSRIDRHETRIQNLERDVRDFDKDIAVLSSKLDTLLDAIMGINVAIRNSVITLVIGAVVWSLVQMGL